MGNAIKLKIPHRVPDGGWDPDQALAKALADRERFLLENPGYRRYQHEIDQVLDKAGSAENRMSVLILLMESKLIELHQQLRDLNRLLLDAV